MSESLFNIFGDHHIRQVKKNVTRQPLSNIENMGKTVSMGPVKPNEPVKKPLEAGKSKKSFLSNTGTALQSTTPARKVFTPRAKNMVSQIYSDDDNGFNMEEVEFTKPSYKYDHYKMDMFDFLLPEPLVMKEESPPSTPTPQTRPHSMELNMSYEDEFYTDDFSVDSLCDDDLGLPSLY